MFAGFAGFVVLRFVVWRLAFVVYGLAVLAVWPARKSRWSLDERAAAASNDIARERLALLREWQALGAHHVWAQVRVVLFVFSLPFFSSFDISSCRW